MRTILCILSICVSFVVNAQGFDLHFEHKTLRLDYIFSGDTNSRNISLEALSQYPQWAGKTKRLTVNPLKGNGNIQIKDKATGKLIYTNSFSSLFQEWLDTNEAKTTRRAYENTCLIPYPKAEVEVTITLSDMSHKEIARLTHTVRPADILIRKKGFEDITPYRIIHKGDVKNPINVVILAEGYTAPEMNAFYTDAQKAVESILSHEPFQSLQNHFNFVAVSSQSNDRGVSIPHQDRWRSTAFSSHFDTFYSERYLTTSKVYAIHDALAGIPYEHIIILANTNQYGGGGIYNAYTLTAAHHETFGAVVVHEFGHSFGGLADEYFYEEDVSDLADEIYPLNVEPWEQNITTLVQFDKKWKNQLKENTPIPTPESEKSKYPIGVYQGGGYATKGVYRPAVDCRMRTNTYPEFCPVCQEALKKLIHFYTEE
ncbi:M64 family metallopeptidase [Bacteroides propionicifaciens]|uniref:M64 family metallopeptidase n=1 Tax=Bacteroides propionicifaciens TaxID=392838 RepID=UPI00046A391A|nr:M64 family metallopeptidase [Bacteroides propionicifaciens]